MHYTRSTTFVLWYKCRTSDSTHFPLIVLYLLLLLLYFWRARCMVLSQSDHWLSHCTEMYVQSPLDLSCRTWRQTCRTTESFTPTPTSYLYMKAYCSLALDRPSRSLTLTSYVTLSAELCVGVTTSLIKVRIIDKMWFLSKLRTKRWLYTKHWFIIPTDNAFV